MTDDNDDFDQAIFNCKDCSLNTSDMGEYYMVQYPVWAAAHGERWEWSWVADDKPGAAYFEFAAKTKGMLCIGCLENRLGRSLAGRDFTDAPINDPVLFHKSERIQWRMAA